MSGFLLAIEKGMEMDIPSLSRLAVSHGVDKKSIYGYVVGASSRLSIPITDPIWDTFRER